MRSRHRVAPRRIAATRPTPSGETPARLRRGDVPPSAILRAPASPPTRRPPRRRWARPRAGVVRQRGDTPSRALPGVGGGARGRGVRGAVQVPAGGEVDEVGERGVVVRRRRRGITTATPSAPGVTGAREARTRRRTGPRARLEARATSRTDPPPPRDGGGAHRHRRRRRRDSTRRVRFRLRLGRAGDARRRLLRLEPPHVGRRELGARRDVVAGRGGGERGRGFAVELGARLRGGNAQERGRHLVLRWREPERASQTRGHSGHGAGRISAFRRTGDGRCGFRSGRTGRARLRRPGGSGMFAGSDPWVGERARARARNARRESDVCAPPLKAVFMDVHKKSRQLLKKPKVA